MLQVTPLEPPKSDQAEFEDFSCDLRDWLPSVLDDAGLRAKLESAAQQVACSSSCLIAARVFHAITGRQAPSRLTTAVSLIFIGVELLDDVADGDIEGGTVAEAEATLLGCLILASLAPRAVASVVPAANTVEALRCVWLGAQAMACGQRDDLSLYGAEYPEPQVVEAALVRSTAECAMYAALGASAAGCCGARIARWEQFGSELGYALEINADCRDVIDPAGRDIARGARTLPISLALRHGDANSSQTLRKDLAAAAADNAARERAREAILELGSIVACGTLVEAAISRAESLLTSLAPLHDGYLRALLNETSFLRPQ